MFKRTHVRGKLAPYNPNAFKAATADKIREGLFDSQLSRIMNTAEISDKGVIEFNYSYATGMGPNLSDVKRRFLKFLRVKEVKELNLQGRITFVLDTDDDFPKLYKLILENGQITFKEATVTWKDVEKP